MFRAQVLFAVLFAGLFSQGYAAELPGLMKNLGSRDELVRGRAAVGLGDMGAVAREAVATLEALAKGDPDVWVRFAATDSLRRIKGEKQLPPQADARRRATVLLQLDRDWYFQDEDIFAKVYFVTDSDEGAALSGLEVNGGSSWLFFDIVNGAGKASDYRGDIKDRFGPPPRIEITRVAPHVETVNLRWLYQPREPSEYRVTARYNDRPLAPDRAVDLRSETLKVRVVKADTMQSLGRDNTFPESPSELFLARAGNERIFVVSRLVAREVAVRRLPDGIGLSEKARLVSCLDGLHYFGLHITLGPGRSLLVNVGEYSPVVRFREVPVDAKELQLRSDTTRGLGWMLVDRNKKEYYDDLPRP
jgi:hypothetical protein